MDLSVAQVLQFRFKLKDWLEESADQFDYLVDLDLSTHLATPWSFDHADP